MADIRGIPASDYLGQGRVTLKVAAAGLTIGRRYWPLALGVDCAPAAPVVYVLTANDQGALVAVDAAKFAFAIDNLDP
jgi:hypothetical protein